MIGRQLPTNQMEDKIQIEPEKIEVPLDTPKPPPVPPTTNHAMFGFRSTALYNECQQLHAVCHTLPDGRFVLMSEIEGPTETYAQVEQYYKYDPAKFLIWRDKVVRIWDITSRTYHKRFNISIPWEEWDKRIRCAMTQPQGDPDEVGVNPEHIEEPKHKEENPYIAVETDKIIEEPILLYRTEEEFIQAVEPDWKQDEEEF